MAKRKPVKPEDRIDFEIPSKDGKKTKAYMDRSEDIHYLRSIHSPPKYPVINETPLDNRIIVLEDKPQTVRPSGIILEGDSAIKPYTGIVLAVGPDCEEVKFRDQVRYAQRAGDKIEIDQEEYLMLRETDCYTILNK